MELLDEVRAVQNGPGGKCATCTWLEAMDAYIRVEWDVIIAKPATELSSASIHTIAKRHGAPVGYSSIVRHRKQGHRA